MPGFLFGVFLREVAVLGTIRAPPMARWQSGYAADCKSVDIGSIPVRASISTF